MKRALLLGSLALVAVPGWSEDGSSRSSPPSAITCEIQATSGLWADPAGGFIGSAGVRWLACSDGNHYRAQCSHRGTWASIESCRCEVNGRLTFEGACPGPAGDQDLMTISRACCQFPRLEPKQVS